MIFKAHHTIKYEILIYIGNYLFTVLRHGTGKPPEDVRDIASLGN